jgi:hypothetical protein
MDKERTVVLQQKRHHFNPDFSFPDDDLHAMRGDAEESRHQGIVRKHHNYTWLNQLAQHLGRLREIPTREEIRTLQIITELINAPTGLDVGQHGFETILRSLEPELLESKEVRKDLLDKIRKLFHLSNDAASQAAKNAGWPELYPGNGSGVNSQLRFRSVRPTSGVSRNAGTRAPTPPTGVPTPRTMRAHRPISAATSVSNL